MFKLNFNTFFLFFILIPSSVFADNYTLTTEDSLLNRIKTQVGEEKLNAYKALHQLYNDNLSDDASLKTFLEFSDEYEKEAGKQKNKRLQGDIKVNSLIDLIRMNAFDDFDKRIKTTLAFLEENNFTESVYVSYKQLILSYCRRGQYDKALNEMKIIYDKEIQHKNEEGRFYTQYLMGVIYMHQNRLEDAERHYRQSIDIGNTMGKMPFGFLQANFELCNMLQATGRLDEFFDTAKQTEILLNKHAEEKPDNSFNTEWMNLWTLYAFAYDFNKDFDKTEFYCNRIDSLSGNDMVSLGNTTFLRAHIWEARDNLPKALTYIDSAIAIDPTYTYARFTKIRILSSMENAPLTWNETERTVNFTDSLRTVSFNKQLDELRTQYEVDKHILEKQKNKNYFFFALGVCCLLFITLAVWIYYNRRIEKKNKALANQIKELQLQHIQLEEEMLKKTTFIEHPAGDDSFCPERRKDQLCIAIRDILLREKAYRNPAITRDKLVERLATNKELFISAFQYCFGMSFTEYLNYLRLKDAVSLLEESDMSIESISEKVGFGSVRTFQRQFQTKYNMSPKEYRKAALV